MGTEIKGQILFTDESGLDNHTVGTSDLESNPTRAPYASTTVSSVIESWLTSSSKLVLARTLTTVLDIALIYTVKVLRGALARAPLRSQATIDF